MSTSTFERMMENEQWKAEFEKGYEEFLISKFLSLSVLDKSIDLPAPLLPVQRNIGTVSYKATTESVPCFFLSREERSS